MERNELREKMVRIAKLHVKMLNLMIGTRLEAPWMVAERVRVARAIRERA